MKNDNKIWNDFRKSENYALPHIYYQYIQILYRYGKKFSRDDEMIKDSIQDLFFDLIRTKNKLGETDNIQFYLLRSLRRKLVRNIKKQKLSIGGFSEKDFVADIVYSAEKEMIEKEELSYRERLVSKGLKELSPKQREILFYRFTCNFDYNEICEIMSLKYDSARKQVFRALRALKKTVSEKDLIVLFFGFFCK